MDSPLPAMVEIHIHDRTGLMNGMLPALDRARTAQGFLTVAATLALGDHGVTVLDPFSTLISDMAELGPGVILWPGVFIQADARGSVRVGAGTVLHPGTRIIASGGRVTVGENAEIGEEGGFTINATGPESTILIGGGTRLLGGGSLSLENHLGHGAQVLGPIRLQRCRLDDGNTHREPDPDLRGGVLKGCGVARGVSVPRGHVIQAFGLFAEAPLLPQRHFHPREPC